ncbi:MAG: acetolactate synthase small subunit [Candidatus Glassbacteria bacterium]|nr:acetolactate synthase small subunit [Candidatus Glassbacteria bacterium]
MQHTISLLVENKFGVLARISNLFSGKGYNLDSICVGKTENPELSRMTIMTSGDDMVIEQIIKQLNRLINVIKVTDLTFAEYVNRELALIKLSCTASTRSSIIQIVEIFQAKIVDISPRTLTIEVTGGHKKVEACIDMLQPFGISEMARTGTTAIKREYTGKSPDWSSSRITA